MVLKYFSEKPEHYKKDNENHSRLLHTIGENDKMNVCQ